MIDASYAIKTAIYGFFLDLTYEGKPVQFMESIAWSDVDPPYVIMSNYTARPDNTKDSFGQIASIVLQVIDRHFEAIYNEDSINKIARMITERLKPTPEAEPLTLEGFTHYSSIESIDDLSQPNRVDIVCRKLITLTFTVSQKHGSG